MTDHKPVTPEYRQTLNDLASGLDCILNPGQKGSNRSVAFAVILFPMQGAIESRVNYISNANRAEMLAAMKEFIARNEGRYHEGDGHAAN